MAGTSPPGYEIRPSRPADVPSLPEIERRAAARFAEIGLGMLAEGPVTEVETFSAACLEGRLWVAQWTGGAEGESGGAEGESVVGFALARLLGGGVHLQEMDVLPEHGRRGLGGRLVTAVIDWARRRRASRVTLTTFRDVAWNAPFYARLGFVEKSHQELSPELRGLVAAELEAGLVPDLRLVMEYRLRATGL